MAQSKNDNILVKSPKDLDDRKGFWLNGEWNLFETPENALADPDVINYRYIGMTIPIWDGTVQSEYWFYGGIADEDFILKEAGSGVVMTSGTQLNADGNLVIDWNNDIVPGEGITYQEKHGDLSPEILITTERESDLSAEVFVPTLNAGGGKNYTTIELIISVDEGDINYTILSKGTSTTPIPPSDFWNDSDNWNDGGTWTD